MRGPLIVSILLVSVIAGGGSQTVALASTDTRPPELDAAIARLYADEATERLGAVQELSGWALDGRYRREAVDHLARARRDADFAVLLQAEVALGSLAGVSAEAVRVAYGIRSPDPGELAAVLLGPGPDTDRHRALIALGRWHGPSHVGPLLAAARDRSKLVRLTALELLSELAADGHADPRIDEALAEAGLERSSAIPRAAPR